MGVASLLQRFNGETYQIPTGSSSQYSEYIQLAEIIGARFVLFRMMSSFSDMNLSPNFARKIERTFAMALKGGLRLFSKFGDQLRICSIHLDGNQQYSRPLDLDFILRKVGQLPSGVQFSTDITFDSRTSNHRAPDSQSYDDCQLLQMTDLLVSGFRTVLHAATHEAQMEISKPLAELAKTWQRGPKGYSNSRWFKGICLSEGYIEDGNWVFGPIEKPSPPIQTAFGSFT